MLGDLSNRFGLLCLHLLCLYLFNRRPGFSWNCSLTLKLNFKFGLVHHFTKLGSGEYYLEELETEVQVTSDTDSLTFWKLSAHLKIVKDRIYIAQLCPKRQRRLRQQAGYRGGWRKYIKKSCSISTYLSNQMAQVIHFVSFLWLTICNPDITDIALKLCSRLQWDPIHDKERLSVAGFIST